VQGLSPSIQTRTRSSSTTSPDSASGSPTRVPRQTAASFGVKHATSEPCSGFLPPSRAGSTPITPGA